MDPVFIRLSTGSGEEVVSQPLSAFRGLSHHPMQLRVHVHLDTRVHVVHVCNTEADCRKLEDAILAAISSAVGNASWYQIQIVDLNEVVRMWKTSRGGGA